MSESEIKSNEEEEDYVSLEYANDGLQFHFRRRVLSKDSIHEAPILYGNMTLHKLRKIKSHLDDINNFYLEQIQLIQNVISHGGNAAFEHLDVHQISTAEKRLEGLLRVSEQLNSLNEEISTYFNRIASKIDAIVWQERYEHELS